MRKHAIWTGCIFAAALSLLSANQNSMAQQKGAADPAQGYPNKPIRWIIDFGAGGLSDSLARIVAQKLTEAWGQPIIVDARPGASGTIAYGLGARATPDGYTLVFISVPFSINVSIYNKLSYDTRKDFAPITLIATYPNVLVTNLQVPAKTVSELITYAKTKPGGPTWATVGVGSSAFLATELFRKRAGFDGADLCAYARHLIAGEIRHYLRDQGTTVRRPRWLYEMDHRVSRAITELTQRKGRAPKIVEIARAVELEERDVHEVLHARESLRFLSLDEEREGDDGAPIAQRDRITTKQASMSMPHEEQVLIADAVERLSGLQRKVIYYLFYLDLTQTEAAQKLGISQKHVSRVMHAALKRLRETMRPEAV